MIEALILGFLQGVVEWLPISSEGVLVVAQNAFSETTFYDALSVALFLHLGTLLSACIYFRKDITSLLVGVSSYSNQPKEKQREIVFLTIATLVSIAVSGVFVIFIQSSEDILIFSGRFINILVGVMLFITAYLQFKGRVKREKQVVVPSDRIAIETGVAQGLSAIPGISRSGATTAIMLIRGMDGETALRYSFLLSIPFVFIGNIALNLGSFSLSVPLLVALVVAFVVGLLSVHAFLAVARKVHFGWFALFFGAILVIAGFL